MEKRIFLAIVISLGFLVLWANVAPKLFPELAKKPVVVKPATPTTTKPSGAPGSSPTTSTSTTTEAGGLKPAAPQVAASAPTTPISAETLQHTVIDTPAYRAVLSNRGAQLVSFKLKKYYRKRSTQLVDLVTPRAANRTDYPFSIEAADPALMARVNTALYSVTERTEEKGHRVVEYRYSDGRVTATKTFRFRPEPYLFDYSVSINPPSPYRVTIGPGIGSAEIKDGKDTPGVINGNGVVRRDGKFKIYPREKGDRTQPFPGVEYIGIEDNYFLTLVRPSVGTEGILRRMRFEDRDTKAVRYEFYAGVNAGRDGVVSGDSFYGPKETRLLDQYRMSQALQFGWFDIIARFLLKALLWINQYTHNYGFAIIVLTVLIKIVLYPLQHKQNVSMKKMQKVAPKIEAIKAKYKKAKSDAEQRQKMNVEVMQLYQKEGINPMAGCLPLLLQLPILWGFYNLLSRAIELRGAPWILWIKDLSEKDPTYILPILMTLTMFLQTYLMPATGDPAQRKIFLIMPFIFGFFFKDFPSGLVLYWLVQNILTIIQQLLMNKWWKDHPDNTKDDLKNDAKSA